MLATPDAPSFDEDLRALDHEIEHHLGQVGLTLFEELAEPLTDFRINAPLMGGTGTKTLTPFGSGTADDWEDWDD